MLLSSSFFRQTLSRILVSSERCHRSAELVHHRHNHPIQNPIRRWVSAISSNLPSVYSNAIDCMSSGLHTGVDNWTRARTPSQHAIHKAVCCYPQEKVPCQFTHTSVKTSDVSFELENDRVVGKRGFQTFNCSYLWLRDHCQCPECYDVNTFQHLVETDAIDPSIVPQTLECTAEGIDTVWPDNHRTILTWEWLEENGPGQQLTQPRNSQEQIFWDGAMLERDLPPDVKFDDLLGSNMALKTLVETLYRYGIACVCEVPPTVDDTQRAVEQIGPAFETFYGKMYLLSADQSFADSSYTSVPLNTHQDTTYFYEPAGLQVLHCLQHDGTGGENIMTDAFQAADVIRRKHPEHFDALCRIPMIGCYIGDARELRTPYYTIALNPITEELQHVRYNVYDRGPLSHLSDADIRAYYEAFRVLSQEIKKPTNVYELKLRPGRVMLFDNWRLLHGRRGFTGKRVMTGCYVSRMEYQNKLRTVAGIKV